MDTMPGDSVPMVRNESFDPFSQPFTIYGPNGKTPFELSLTDVAKIQINTVQQAIMFGSQIGASAILLLVLILMTGNDKRRSAIFLLNGMALLINTIRNILQCLQLTGPFYNFYVYQTEEYTDAPGLLQAKQISITAGILTFLVIVCIEASLVLQVRIVCCTLNRVKRWAITILSTIVALLAVGFRMALVVINSYSVANVETYSHAAQQHLNLVASATNITLTVSIVFFSFIFCGKLALAIISRRSMGLTQFGPMQIVFVMGCQTLLLPTVFAILTYFVLPQTQLNSFVATIVAIFLPLSGMWASANANSRRFGGGNKFGRRMMPLGPTDPRTGNTSRGSTMMSSEKKHLNSPGSNTYDEKNTSLESSSFGKSPTKSTGGNDERSIISGLEDNRDLEMGDGIKIDRTYTVHSHSRD